MINKVETDKFIPNQRRNSSSTSTKCCPKWWNQHYPSQRIIARIIESIYFHALIIFLVVVDAALVVLEIILDSLKTQFECSSHVHHALEHHNEMMIKRIEGAMEIMHFVSIAILTFFVLELIVKVYSFGREFWNIHRRKMEYFDAFIVITSLCIDVYFLQGEEKVLGERLPLVLSFRLWRFVRIISSVMEATLTEQAKHKAFLNRQYLASFRRLVELLTYKTSFIENSKDDINATLEHLRMIDSKCHSSLETFEKNHELTSTKLLTQFMDELVGLENTDHPTVITAMFAKSSDV